MSVWHTYISRIYFFIYFYSGQTGSNMKQKISMSQSIYIVGWESEVTNFKNTNLQESFLMFYLGFL